MIVAWIDPGDYLSVSLPCNEGDVFYGEFHLVTEGVVQFFVCDEANLALWREGGAATQYDLVSGVSSRSWSIQIPEEGRWCGVIVSEQGSQPIRVSASCNKVSPLQILGRNMFFGFEIAAFSLIGILSLHLVRKRRNQREVHLIELEAASEVDKPGAWLGWFRNATALTLVLQSLLITAVVVLEISVRWEPDSPYNGFNVLFVFYLIPLFLPLLCAKTLLQRRMCKGVLMMWSVPALVLGNFFLWGWYGGAVASLLLWALAFAVPTWLYFGFVLAEAIMLHRPRVQGREVIVITNG